jgi:hypothetical protein
VKHIEDLIDVIRELHGAEPTHRESVPIKETWNGQTIWEGIVEVFHLHGHPETDTVYAWSHDTDDPNSPKRHVTVLHVHPATSPLMAVRTAIARDYYASAAQA